PRALLALAGGLVLVVENPARQAFVTETVPPAHLQPAVALAAAVFQMTRLVGPPVRGGVRGRGRRRGWGPRPARCAPPCGTWRSVRRWPRRSCWWGCWGCSG